MSRMHSRKRGKASSVKPSKAIHPTWIRYKKKEAEMLILKLAKEGKSASEIGIIMRDTYGIPDIKVACQKSVSNILKEAKLSPEIPEDLHNLIRKAGLVKKHLDENHKDMPALRGLQLTEAKIKRLMKYYKRSGRLPEDWKYEREKAIMFVD